MAGAPHSEDAPKPGLNPHLEGGVHAPYLTAPHPTGEGVKGGHSLTLGLNPSLNAAWCREFYYQELRCGEGWASTLSDRLLK